MADNKDVEQVEESIVGAEEDAVKAEKKPKKDKKNKKKDKKDEKSPYLEVKPLDITPQKNEQGEYICPHCKKVIEKDVLVCPHCRRAVRIKHLDIQHDSGDPLLGFLCFFTAPFGVGIFLYFKWRKTKPRNAKIALISAIAFYAIFLVLAISLFRGS